MITSGTIMQFDIDAEHAWPLRHALARDLQGSLWSMSLALLPGSRRMRLSLALSGAALDKALPAIDKLAPGTAVSYVRENPGASTGMPTVARLLDAEHVLLNLDVADQNALFEHVASVAAQQYGVDAETVLTHLAHRESSGSTALGQGVAVPHARIPGVPCEMVFYARLKTPLAFGAADGRPVTDVICLLLPEWASNIHLHLLASVAELFCDHRFRERLRQCDNARAVVHHFKHGTTIQAVAA
ncbi:hypothetical protein LMG32289_05772 [Cupriavidus pampae]|uniref:PTS EIIA type-2 domain-containing protein n=2 Tax=Cupriavidus pampae TaxID=659251 RepID=A0ABM8XWU6_9BURK|nr:hypothetical protein LMG32289_05772 [Cupriavidus pampae]